METPGSKDPDANVQPTDQTAKARKSKSGKTGKSKKDKAPVEQNPGAMEGISVGVGGPVGPVTGQAIATPVDVTTQARTIANDPQGREETNQEEMGESSHAAQQFALRNAKDGDMTGAVTQTEIPPVGEIWSVLKTVVSQLAVLTQTVTPAENPTVGQSTRVRATVPANGERTGLEAEVVEIEPPSARISRKVDYLSVLEHISRLGTRHFKGSADPIEADEWRSRLVRNFSSTRCPEDYKKDIAVHFLEGDAHNWWLMVNKRTGGRIETFAEFETEFNRKYFPSEAWDRLESDFLDLVQGRRTVREYEEEFNRLRRFVGRELEDESVQVRRFLRGLRVELRTHCSVRTFSTVSELVERAAMVEANLAEENKVKAPTRSNTVTRPGDRKRKWDQVDDHSRSSSRRENCAKCGRGHSGECWRASGACLKCGSHGHRFQNCPRMEQGRGTSDEGRQCYHCGKTGHFQKDCPKSRVETQMRAKGNFAKSDQAAQSKRPTVAPRVYELTKETGEAGNFSAITGTSLSPSLRI